MEKEKAPGWISEAYLVWIGSEFYPSITSYEDEAIVQGISKRIPTVAMGRKLMEPGTVVFVAHDEGKKKTCKTCAGMYECPACRKRAGEIAEHRTDVLKMLARYDEFPGELFKKHAPKAAQQFVELREKKIEKLEKEQSKCVDCSGKGRIHGGTGGYVKLTTGQTWDYRKYNYHLHQPKKFDPESLLEKKAMCVACGGTGDLPIAQIFGVFVPEKLEYILTGEESSEALALIPDAEKITLDVLKVEAKRRCGKRKPGGFYVVTDSSGTKSMDAAKAVADLSKRGLLDKAGCEINGSFIRFLKPIGVNEKRFRGIKRLEMDKLSKGAKVAAMDIREAIA